MMKLLLGLTLLLTFSSLTVIDAQEEPWTIIQQRSEGPMEEFYLGWTEYENGFGSINGNYWIGLDTIHNLTSSSNHELRIELGDWTGQTRYALYRTFRVGNATDNYRLTVGDYEGDAGDALEYHNSMPWSTHDRDNDLDEERNCAQEFHGAWWYYACYDSNLNGYYFSNGSSPGFDGIAWGEWEEKSDYSLKTVQMKIRPLVL